MDDKIWNRYYIGAHCVSVNTIDDIVSLVYYGG